MTMLIFFIRLNDQTRISYKRDDLNILIRIFPFSFHGDQPNWTIYRMCNNISNTTGATCGAGAANPSGAPEITPSFWWGLCLVFSFLCCFFCTIICLFVFLFLTMALLVYFLSMSLALPLVSFVPLFQFLCNKVPTAPSFGVSYISVCMSRLCMLTLTD